MSSRIKARWKLAAGAGAVLVLLLAALRIAAHREALPPADPGPAPAASAAATSAAAPAAETRAPAATEATPPAAPQDTPEAAPDDPGDLSAAPPLPTRDQVRARPTPAADAPDQDQIIDPQQASLDLVERSIERLEAVLQAAERAGDDAAARQSRIRIERLRLRRAALQAERADAP